MGIYESSIKRPFTDFKRLGAGFLWNIIPIVNFVAIGYSLRCAKLSMKNNFEMPSWDKKSELFMNGLYFILISLIYSLPIIVLSITLFFSFIIKLDFLKLQDQSYLMDVIKNITANNLGTLILLLILLILTAYIVPSAIMNFVNKNKFSQAFEFSLVFKKAFTKQYFVTTLLMFLYMILIYFLLAFIPLVGRILAGFLTYVTMYSAYGAIYNKL